MVSMSDGPPMRAAVKGEHIRRADFAWAYLGGSSAQSQPPMAMSYRCGAFRPAAAEVDRVGHEFVQVHHLATRAGPAARECRAGCWSCRCVWWRVSLYLGEWGGC